MNDEELRDEIYRRLGVEKGSLTSESGNDWQRAKNEVLEDWKLKEQQNNHTEDKPDYITLSKDSNLFMNLLKNPAHNIQEFKSTIATRSDLNENEMLLLVQTGSKEVLINLSKQLSLPTSVIDLIITNGVYMAKKYLIEHQELSDDQKYALLVHMKLYPETYHTLVKEMEQ